MVALAVVAMVAAAMVVDKGVEWETHSPEAREAAWAVR